MACCYLLLWFIASARAIVPFPGFPAEYSETFPPNLAFLMVDNYCLEATNIFNATEWPISLELRECVPYINPNTYAFDQNVAFLYLVFDYCMEAEVEGEADECAAGQYVELGECDATKATQMFTVTTDGVIKCNGFCLTGDAAAGTVQLQSCDEPTPTSQMWSLVDNRGRPVPTLFLRVDRTESGTEYCLDVSNPNRLRVSICNYIEGGGQDVASFYYGGDSKQCMEIDWKSADIPVSKCDVHVYLQKVNCADNPTATFIRNEKYENGIVCDDGGYDNKCLTALGNPLNGKLQLRYCQGWSTQKWRVVDVNGDEVPFGDVPSAAAVGLARLGFEEPADVFLDGHDWSEHEMHFLMLNAFMSCLISLVGVTTIYCCFERCQQKKGKYEFVENSNVDA